jgi:hypothetical protein
MNMPKLPISSVTKVLSTAINDLLKIENENNAEAHNIEIRIADMQAALMRATSECNSAYELRVKLEGMLK